MHSVALNSLKNSTKPNLNQNVHDLACFQDVGHQEVEKKSVAGWFGANQNLDISRYYL